jgi:hypothetical protein
VGCGEAFNPGHPASFVAFGTDESMPSSGAHL